MTVLKCANSGCASNSSAVNGGGMFSSRVLVSSMGIGPSAMSDYSFHLASQLLVGDTASHDLFHDSAEPLRIRQRTKVIPERLFVQVPKQVERLYADIGSMQSALQQTPEVLHRVRVDVAVHVLNSVVDNGVLVVVLQPVVRLQGIAENSGPGFNAVLNDWLELFLGTGSDMSGDNITATLDHPKYNFFILAARAGNLLGPFVFMHVPRLAADKSLVYFDFPAQLVEGAILHGKADAVEHEPCGFLSDAQTTVDFVGTYSVLAVDDKPRGREPLFQGKRGILKDSPGFERERRLRVPDVALPHAGLGAPSYTLGAAFGAGNLPVGPAQFHHELTAVLKVGEVQNRVSEGCFAVHDSSLPESVHHVKYIIASSRPITTS
jgi:hypothetical protein